MSMDEVRRLADSVMYEGYVLYPYRASAQKNRSRWQFGVLMPPEYCAADPSETSRLRAECVFEHSDQPSVEIVLRFLHVQRRTGGDAPAWDEAVAREVSITAGLNGLMHDFKVPGGAENYGGVLRRRAALAGTVTVRTTPADPPWPASRLAVTVTNRTVPESPLPGRDDALPYALVAAHLIVTVSGGEFVSLTDPPRWAAPTVAACENSGCWPVPAGDRYTMLAAPIMLPDYPQLAPESPGELYDGTEIDEILTLRTLALSDAEKAAARATDPLAAALIDRVETMDADTLTRLHGTIRPVPAAESVTVAGQRVSRGSRVTLRPGVRRTDAQDMFLAGKTGIVEAVLRDVEDVAYLAVTLADDPDADLRAAHGRFLYFAPDEVVPQ